MRLHVPLRVLLAAALLLIAVPALARAASVVDRASGHGDYATAIATGTADSPSWLKVRVTASPRQRVTGNWTVVCTKGTGAGSRSGRFSGRAPLTRKMKLPTRHPDSCTVSALGSLEGAGNSVKVTITAG